MFRQLLNIVLITTLLLSSLPQGALAITTGADIMTNLNSAATGVEHTISFTTAVAIPAGGWVDVTFPAEFTALTAPTGATGLNASGFSVAGQVATVNSNGAAPGAMSITGITATNPSALGAYQIRIETKNAGGILLEQYDVAVYIIFNTPINNVLIGATVVNTSLVPRVTNFTPTSNPNNSQINLVIIGQFLENVYAVNLDDPAITALTDIIYVSATEIHAQVPAGITPGTYNIQVSTTNGTNATSDVKFVVSAPTGDTTPSIDAISPSPISVNAGSTAPFTVTVSDTNSVNVKVTYAPATGAVIPPGPVTAVPGVFSATFDATALAASATTLQVTAAETDDSNPDILSTDVYVFPAW